MVLDELLKEYIDMFGEAFPLMCCMGMARSEIADSIRNCIDSGKPFEPEEGADY